MDQTSPWAGQLSYHNLNLKLGKNSNPCFGNYFFILFNNCLIQINFLVSYLWGKCCNCSVYKRHLQNRAKPVTYFSPSSCKSELFRYIAVEHLRVKASQALNALGILQTVKSNVWASSEIRQQSVISKHLSSFWLVCWMLFLSPLIFFSQFCHAKNKWINEMESFDHLLNK